MDASMWVAKTGLDAQQTRMNVISNNLANVSTTGFKRDRAVFEDLLYQNIRQAGGQTTANTQAPTGLMLGTGTKVVATEKLHIQGNLINSQNPLDVAIMGDGFFQIQTPGGTRLSRAGHFMPNNQGDLVTPDGYRVLDAGGAPLGIPQGTGKISISADGTLSSKGQLLGQLGIVQPSTGTQILREDGVHFRADGPTEPNFDARVRQGFLEGSNVNPMSQIARMIEVQRAYEMGQSFAETENERLRNAVRTIIK